MRVVVVGAGIVGAAVAHEVARAGADVVLLDAGPPASGVTADSFAWIGEPRGSDPPDASTPLRRLALAEHRRLEAQVPGARVRWRGCVTWGAQPFAADVPLGPGERLLDAGRLARLEPHLRVRPERSPHLVRDGAVDPVALVRALARAARARGARVLPRTAATGLDVRGARVTGVRTTAGTVPADAVVLAAGTGTRALCAPLGLDLPVAGSPALLVRLSAPPGLVGTLVAAPDLEVREAAAGLLLATAGEEGAGGDPRAAGEEVRRRVLDAFDVAPGAVRVLGARTGVRPVPADGLPLTGPVPGTAGLHVAVLHAALTLAPAVARLLAAEVVHGAEAAELVPLRPGRPVPAGWGG
ncbi:NAD(P)/FAD-dependent oxidoreductase [Kineococcus terrestris]|uniref:NAD(P)/FAD-dependent oxidoreductase n=1 Tax=Kineococcus terrestris TaxID=2044856 RepID=UPI0034DB600C